jgi:hypothetical protein
MLLYERRRRSVGLLLGVSLALAGCGSGGDDTAADSAAPSGATTTVEAQANGGSAAAAPTTVGSTSPGEGAAAPSAEPSPICDTIPSFEAISAIVGETVHTAEDNSDPTIQAADGSVLSISQRCDVSGDGIGNAIFQRWDPELGAGILATAESEGQLADYAAPGLPDAVAWANGIAFEHEGLTWYVTAITLDTVGVMDAPAAYDASAELMLAWVNG